MLLLFLSSVKFGAARVLVMGVTEIHLRVYRETVWHFESKERLGKVRENFVTEYTTYSFVR
jgi:hypothetical protein